MNKEALVQRRAEAESKFSALQDKKNNLQEEIKNIETELVQLQGEHRVLSDLINQFVEVKKSKVSPKANVIDADAALEETK